MTHARFGMGLTLLGLLAMSSICASADPAAPAASVEDGASLYARMGGAATISAVIDELVDHSASDPRLKRSFEGVDLARLKRLLVEHICSLTGGGCTYSGDSMRDVHAGLEIDQSEFYGLVEALRDALRHHGVGLSERNELLQILAPMKRDIVER